MPRGGARVGAGRKPWKYAARIVDGGVADTVAGESAAEPVGRRGLGVAARKVWDGLAPKATARGTLTGETAYAFAVLCRLCVQVDKVHAALELEGLTPDGRYLARLYLGLVQRQETQLRAFRIAPEGKAIAPVEAPKAKSAFERLKDQRQGLHAIR